MSTRALRGDEINWNQVFYFSEIAAAGSVKIAAEKLGLSSSTLSEHLSQLEADLDVRLFQRQHRRLVLTSEGARLYQCAKQMFETGKRFIDAISPTPLGCYPISIGLVPGAAYAFAHKTIGAYITRHQDASAHVFRVQHDELELKLLEGKMDFGFTDRKSERRDIAQMPVVASELRFFVAQSVEGSDLRKLLELMPLVVCRSGRQVPSPVEEMLEAIEIQPQRIVVSEYPSLVESLCHQGIGVAALGHQHFAQDQRVKMLPLPSGVPPLKEKLYVAWAAAGENSEAVARLRALLEDMTPPIES